MLSTKDIFSYRSRERTYRIILISVLSLSLLISCAALYYASKVVVESKRNIYVMVNDKALVQAVSTDIQNTVDILARGQVENLHQNLFTLMPDSDQINKQLKRCQEISDKSVYNFIQAYKQGGFYKSVINENFFTILTTNTENGIQIDYSVAPYKFRYTGILKLQRNGNTYYREIITEGELEQMGSASVNNERGFIIRNLKLISDRDLQ